MRPSFAASGSGGLDLRGGFKLLTAMEFKVAPIGVIFAALLAVLPLRAQSLDFDTMTHGRASGLVDNSAFLPGTKARAAKQDFTGTIALGEIEMATKPEKFASRDVLCPRKISCSAGSTATASFT